MAGSRAQTPKQKATAHQHWTPTFQTAPNKNTKPQEGALGIREGRINQLRMLPHTPAPGGRWSFRLPSSLLVLSDSSRESSNGVA